MISGPQEVNQTETTNQTNNTDTSIVQAENLTDGEMESIKGQQLSASANMQLTAEEMQTIRGRWLKELGRWIWDGLSAAAGHIANIGPSINFTHSASGNKTIQNGTHNVTISYNHTTHFTAQAATRTTRTRARRRR